MMEFLGFTLLLVTILALSEAIICKVITKQPLRLMSVKRAKSIQDNIEKLVRSGVMGPTEACARYKYEVGAFYIIPIYSRDKTNYIDCFFNANRLYNADKFDIDYPDYEGENPWRNLRYDDLL
jgi:hypothetical protein